MKKYSKPKIEEIKERLSDLQFQVTQNSQTEKPFINEYNNFFKEGIYVDIVTKEPLFSSTDKFNSGCGWPAFSKPIEKERVIERTDTSHNMVRVEVRSKDGNSHLGHVFNDGPKNEGGLRYCINSASLKFISKAEMKAEGYEDYLYLFE